MGNGRKYFLHLVSPEDLKTRGMTERKAKLMTAVDVRWLQRLENDERALQSLQRGVAARNGR